MSIAVFIPKRSPPNETVIESPNLMSFFSSNEWSSDAMIEGDKVVAVENFGSDVKEIALSLSRSKR
jgi:hypothetical protein